MREHMGLYRGKRIDKGIDNGEWVQGAFCPKNSRTIFGKHEDIPNIIKLDDPYSGFWFEVDPDTVGECTGLRDKNGNLIFENHKLKSDGEVYEVRMDCGEWRMFDKTDHYCELYIYAGNSEIVSEG